MWCLFDMMFDAYALRMLKLLIVFNIRDVISVRWIVDVEGVPSHRRRRDSKVVRSQLTPRCWRHALTAPLRQRTGATVAIPLCGIVTRATSPGRYEDRLVILVGPPHSSPDLPPCYAGSGEADSPRWVGRDKPCAHPSGEAEIALPSLHAGWASSRSFMTQEGTSDHSAWS
jgi:hypothetical protein